MLYAVIGTSAGKSRDEIMTIFPRHKHSGISSFPAVRLWG